MSSIYQRLTVYWDGTNGTEETGNVIRANGTIRINPPGEAILGTRGIVNDATFVLRNPSGRYSPLRTDGGLYAYIGGGAYYQKKIKFEVSIDGGSNYTPIFTGVIKNLRESGTSSKAAPEIELTCRDMADKVLQKKLTTTRAGMVTRHDQSWNENAIMKAFLEAAGLTETTDFVLDPGLLVIPWSWLDDESVLEDIWQLAAACGGRVMADRNGIIVYENATHWLYSPHTTSQETISTSGFQRLAVRYDDANLYNSVTVEVAPRQLAGDAVLWEPDEEISIPAGATKTVVAKLRQPVYSISATPWHATTTGGADISADVSLSLTEYAQRVHLNFTNGNATYAAQVRALQIIGRGVEGAPSAEETATSADAFWADRAGRNRSVRGNPYIQTRPQGAMLAAMLTDWQDTPRLVFSLQGCPGNPLRTVGYRFTVSDANSLSSNREAFIVGLSWRYDVTGYRQDIEAIDATSYYPYSAYFLVGTDTLGASTDPVFY